MDQTFVKDFRLRLQDSLFSSIKHHSSRSRQHAKNAVLNDAPSQEQKDNDSKAYNLFQGSSNDAIVQELQYRRRYFDSQFQPVSKTTPKQGRKKRRRNKGRKSRSKPTARRLSDEKISAEFSSKAPRGKRAQLDIPLTSFVTSLPPWHANGGKTQAAQKNRKRLSPRQSRRKNGR